MQENISLKLFSDIGMGEIFMSRLFDFNTRILNGLFDTTNGKEIKDAIFVIIFDGLEPAFRSLRVLRTEWTDMKIPEKKKKQDIENVYSYLTLAFKDRFQKAAKLMGYDIGFLSQNDSKFEVGYKKFLELHPKISPELIEIMRNDRNGWLSLMTQVRNQAIEHAADSEPTLKKELEQNMTLEIAEAIFDNCWRAIEDYLIVFVIDKINPIYGHTILELPEYRQDKNYPQRFGWYFKLYG